MDIDAIFPLYEIIIFNVSIFFLYDLSLATTPMPIFLSFGVNFPPYCAILPPFSYFVNSSSSCRVLCLLFSMSSHTLHLTVSFYPLAILPLLIQSSCQINIPFDLLLIILLHSSRQSSFSSSYSISSYTFLKIQITGLQNCSTY